LHEASRIHACRPRRNISHLHTKLSGACMTNPPTATKTQPSQDQMAMIIGIPHSGRNIDDAALMGCGHWTRAEHAQFADPYLDVLTESLKPMADGLVVQHTSRSLVDTNRCPGDQANDGPCHCDGELHKNAIGLGLMPKRVSTTRLLERHEHEMASRRALFLHSQYHEKMAYEVQKHTNKQILILELHSMPGRSGRELGWCVGNRFGASSAPWMLELVMGAIAKQYPREHVAANSPFAGLYSAWLHGKPEQDVHFLQLEANRQLIGTTPEDVQRHQEKIANILAHIKKEGPRRSPKFNREETPSKGH